LYVFANLTPISCYVYQLHYHRDIVSTVLEADKNVGQLDTLKITRTDWLLSN